MKRNLFKTINLKYKRNKKQKTKTQDKNWNSVKGKFKK